MGITAKTMKPWLLALCAAIGFVPLPRAAFSNSPTSFVRSEFRPGDFPLVRHGKAATLCVDPGDAEVVGVAAGLLADDVERVSGVRPRQSATTETLKGPVVLIGTLGQSSVLDALVRSGRLDASSIAGQWECFLIQTLSDPRPGCPEGLIIAGSDRRGTAFGVFHLSQEIGVSPWYWWADVPSPHREELTVAKGTRTEGPPSVQYRGIFLNDEDWGLHPWAAKTFDPETGDIGPKTYARVCELLLRLKANYLWPAMHGCTREFNFYPENKRIADRYAIVMGSAHCEQMLCNNVWFDTRKNGPWEYDKNRENIYRYWEDRLRENGRFENTYMLGIRGIHDEGMRGEGSMDERVALMERIIADQREILTRWVSWNGPPVQVFCPYKEVLSIYRAGLNVPDDVTLLWVDDNRGYIRQLSSPAERTRKGGSGVYYHVSYLGPPQDYLWLNTTPPELIWEEMTKAYTHDARKIWMLNVGDLKRREIGADFFLRLAWDVSRWDENTIPNYLDEFSADTFPGADSREIGAILRGYFRLGFHRKPEDMGWTTDWPDKARLSTEFSSTHGNDEAQRRLDDYDALARRAEAVCDRLPDSMRDSFFELVLYPVRCSRLMSRKFILADKSRLYAAQGRASASDYADGAREAFEAIQAETEHYNSQVANGKWRRMVSWNPIGRPVFSMPEVGRVTPLDKPALGIAVEGHAQPIPLGEPPENGKTGEAANPSTEAASLDLLPVFDSFGRQRRFIDLFNRGRGNLQWAAETESDWILLSEREGSLESEKRLWVDIDWDRAPRGESLSGSVVIRGGGRRAVVQVRASNPEIPDLQGAEGFVESNNRIVMEAEHYTHKVDAPEAQWKAIRGLGRTGDSMSVFPMDAPGRDPAGVASSGLPCLEYRIYLHHPGAVDVAVETLPTHPVHSGCGARYTVALNDAPARVVDFSAEEFTEGWSRNVMRGAAVTHSSHRIPAAGWQTLRIGMIDPGVVIDRIIVQTGPEQDATYLGPPETRILPRATRME